MIPMRVDVLILDDRDALLDSVVEPLTAFEVSAIGVPSAEMGRARLEEISPAVISRDVSLSGISVFDFIR